MNEINSDGRTVWVNDHTGCCIGRFSKAGIDVHHTGAVQIETGQQCQDCKPGPTTLEDWRSFQTSMQRYHGVAVKDLHMPKFLKKDSTQ